jgi:hypothetical protein
VAKHILPKLIEFRQAVYSHVFRTRRDALFTTLDDLLAGGTCASFAYLSQSERFQHKWPNLYAAVEDGQLESQVLHDLLVRLLPQQGVCAFPSDGSSCPRPRSRVLEDLQYVCHTSSEMAATSRLALPPRCWNSAPKPRAAGRSHWTCGALRARKRLRMRATPASRPWRKRGRAVPKPWILSRQTGNTATRAF